MKRLVQTFIFLIPTLLISQYSDFTTNFINYDGQTVQTASAKLDFSAEDIKQHLEDWMRNYHKVDFNGQELDQSNYDVLTIENVVIPSISDKPIQMDFKIDEVFHGKTILNVFVKNYSGVYVSLDTHKECFIGLERVVHEFLADYLTRIYNEERAKKDDKTDNSSEADEEPK